jgi:hypothetical protein
VQVHSLGLVLQVAIEYWYKFRAVAVVELVTVNQVVPAVMPKKI